MRFFTIAWYLAPIVVSFARDWRRWIWWGRGVPRTEEFHRRRADRVVKAVARLGPSFVKMAQVFASRSDVIPEPYVGRLSTLTDQVPAVPIGKIRAAIERSYGRTPEQIFEQFNEVPIAAASLGQVHRARYRGEDVVIKVLRPGVEELVRRDLAVFKPLLRWVERRFPNVHVRNAQAVIEEFSVRIWEEMDFVHEAANATEVRANFTGNPRVIVPRVIPELTRQRTLVLEFVEGVRVDQLAPHDGEFAADPRGVISGVMELYLRMMLVDGFFHADPHPGNVLVHPDGRIVILDFGMVIRVSKPMRADLVRTVFAAIRRDTRGIVEGFRSLGLLEPGVTTEQLMPLADRLMSIAYDPATLHDRIQLLAQEVISLLYDWPVRLTSEMVYFARTAALIEGLGARYDAHFNPITFASPIAIRMRHDILRSLDMEDGSSVIDYPTIVGAALGTAARKVAEWWGGLGSAGVTRRQINNGSRARVTRALAASTDAEPSSPSSANGVS